MQGDPPSKTAKLCHMHVLGVGSMEMQVLGLGAVWLRRYWQLLGSFQNTKTSKTHLGGMHMMGKVHNGPWDKLGGQGRSFYMVVVCCSHLNS